MKKYTPFIALLAFLLILISGCDFKPVLDYEFIHCTNYNGTVQMSTNRARPGEIVTMTIIPNEGYVFNSISFDQKVLYTIESESFVSFIMPAEEVYITVSFEENDEVAYKITSNITRGNIYCEDSRSMIKAGTKVVFSITPDIPYNGPNLILDEDSLKVMSAENPIEFTKEAGKYQYSFIMPEGNVNISAICLLPVFVSVENPVVVAGDELSLLVDNRSDKSEFYVDIDETTINNFTLAGSEKSTEKIDTTGLYAGLHKLTLYHNFSPYSQTVEFYVNNPGMEEGWTSVSFSSRETQITSCIALCHSVFVKLNSCNVIKAKIKYYYDDLSDSVYEQMFDFTKKNSVELENKAPSKTSVLHLWVEDQALKVKSEMIDLIYSGN